jgi:hypothetical protein
MELRAVIETLKYLPPHMTVWVSTDSKYENNGITEWIHKWQQNGWKNSKKNGVHNATLWIIIILPLLLIHLHGLAPAGSWLHGTTACRASKPGKSRDPR